MKKTVLIFGISGFVGGYLAREFIDNNYKVYGSDVLKPAYIYGEIEFKRADLTSYEDIQDLINEIHPDVIINLAAVSSVGGSWKMPQTTVMINVVGSLNILEAVRRTSPLSKIMFVGSSEEYSESNEPISENTALNSNNPYGISKVTQEKFADLYRKRYGMKIYCVRPFNHTGIGQKETFALPSFCKQAAEIENSGKPGVIKVGNLSVKRDFSHVKDIVRAYRLIIENCDDSKIFNIGSGIAYSLSEMLDFIISLSSQKITVEIDRTRFRPADTPVICCDNSLIYDEIGWKPEYSIFDALKEIYNDFLNKNKRN